MREHEGTHRGKHKGTLGPKHVIATMKVMKATKGDDEAKRTRVMKADISRNINIHKDIHINMNIHININMNLAININININLNIKNPYKSMPTSLTII